MSEFNNGNDMYERGKFILIYQKYIREDNPQQLTPKELYTMITLRNHTTTLNQNILITTFNTIAYILPFLKYKESKLNAREARKIMDSLRIKGVINYVEPKDSNSPFEIHLEEIKFTDSMDTQFLAVPDHIIETTNDPDELYVLIVVYNIARWDDQGENSKPFFRNKRNWHGLLSVKSPSTAEKIINRMIEKKILFFYENDCTYDDENEKFNQDAGKYYLYEQPKEVARINAMKERQEENRRKRTEYQKERKEFSI